MSAKSLEDVKSQIARQTPLVDEAIEVCKEDNDKSALRIADISIDNCILKLHCQVK